MAPMEVPAMILGRRPSSSNTSSMRMWASPRAPPPPSARAMLGRPAGTVGLRTATALLRGFMTGRTMSARNSRRRTSGARPPLREPDELCPGRRLSGRLPRPAWRPSWLLSHRSEERHQRGQRVLRVLLRQEVAGPDLRAGQLPAPRPPDVERPGTATAEILAAPQHEGGAGDPAAGGEVGLVQPAVDGGAGAVVLAHGLHARRILHQGAVVGQRLGRERREVARARPALQRMLQVVDGLV